MQNKISLLGSGCYLLQHFGARHKVCLVYWNGNHMHKLGFSWVARTRPILFCNEEQSVMGNLFAELQTVVYLHICVIVGAFTHDSSGHADTKL